MCRGGGKKANICRDRQIRVNKAGTGAREGTPRRQRELEHTHRKSVPGGQNGKGSTTQSMKHKLDLAQREILEHESTVRPCSVLDF